jgi:hypothetical protein
MHRHRWAKLALLVLVGLAVWNVICFLAWQEVATNVLCFPQDDEPLSVCSHQEPALRTVVLWNGAFLAPALAALAAGTAIREGRPRRRRR